MWRSGSNYAYMMKERVFGAGPAWFAHFIRTARVSSSMRYRITRIRSIRFIKKISYKLDQADGPQGTSKLQKLC